MTALIGVTLILAVTTDVGGLPALPAVAFGFLLANADLIWHALRRRGRAPVRIYGRTDTDFYDLDADVIERGASVGRRPHPGPAAGDGHDRAGP